MRDRAENPVKAKQELIFEKFYQYDLSHKRKHPGLGLGLTLSKKLSEALGGKIWVESDVDKGTTFHFLILKQQ